MKEIRKILKDKLWEFSVNSLVMMKAVPLCSRSSPLIENIVRKKVTDRKDL